MNKKKYNEQFTLNDKREIYSRLSVSKFRFGISYSLLKNDPLKADLRKWLISAVSKNDLDTRSKDQLIRLLPER